MLEYRVDGYIVESVPFRYPPQYLREWRSTEINGIFLPKDDTFDTHNRLLRRTNKITNGKP